MMTAPRDAEPAAEVAPMSPEPPTPDEIAAMCAAMHADDEQERAVETLINLMADATAYMTLPEYLAEGFDVAVKAGWTFTPPSPYRHDHSGFAEGGCQACEEVGSDAIDAAFDTLIEAGFLSRETRPRYETTEPIPEGWVHLHNDFNDRGRFSLWAEFAAYSEDRQTRWFTLRRIEQERYVTRWEDACAAAGEPG